MSELASESSAQRLLEVENLSVDYGTARAVHDVSLHLDDGELVGLLGESGSGKSTLGNAILRLLSPPARISAGTVALAGTDITHLDDAALRPLRWRTMSTVFQSSMNSLNPVLTIEAQFRDALERGDDPPRDLRARIAELLEMVLIEPRFMRSYPHELSGGMKQRVALAMALALRPRLVVLDEPTTGLDVVVQRSILDNLRALQREQRFGVLLISHDLGTVMEIADRMLVMYAGRIVESAPKAAMVRDARHPYTRGLLGSYADPRAESVDIAFIPGRPPELRDTAPGCAFAPRCPDVIARCRVERPPLVDGVACHVAAAGTAVAQPEHALHAGSGARARTGGPLLRVAAVAKSYAGRGRRAARTQAVDDVSFTVDAGEVVALVGQSGSGKTTLGRMITGIERPDTGEINLDEVAVHRLRGKGLRAYRRRVQLVFQDPFASLIPTRPVSHALLRPLANYHGLTGAPARRRAGELLEQVGLEASHLDRFPHQLSGGQRQRVVIARALAPEPDLLVADEPVSMLDVSIRAELLALLRGVVAERGLGMLYITHDLLSARVLADTVLVLSAGRLVESGPTVEVIRHARDPYTQELLAALPRPILGRS